MKDFEYILFYKLLKALKNIFQIILINNSELKLS